MQTPAQRRSPVEKTQHGFQATLVHPCRRIYTILAEE
jgi:hypothetical protein